MIKEIYLENWKSHEKSKIGFDKINLIIGRMGSGKTSIIDAISYALFGNFSGLNSKKIKLEDIISKKPREKDYARIILKIHFNGKSYEILRVIEKNKGSYAEIKEEGKIICSGTSDTNEFIKKLIKMDFKTFSDVIYAEQNKIDFFLNLERNERKIRFDQLIGIEKLEKIRKTTISVKNRLLDIYREKQRFLSQILNEKLDEKLIEIENQIKDLNSKVIELSKNKKIFEEEIKKIINLIEDGKLVKSEIEKLETEIIKKRSKYEKLREILEKLTKEIRDENEENILLEIEKIDNETQNILRELNCEEKILKDLDLETNKIVEELVDLRNKFERKNKLEKRREEFEKLEEEIEKAKNSIEKLRENNLYLKSRLKELENEKNKEEKLLEILREDFSICPICETQIDVEKKKYLILKHSDIYKKILDEIEALYIENKNLEKKIKENEKIFEDLLFKYSEKKKIEEELEILRSIKKEKIEELEKILSESKRKNQEIKENLSKKQKRISELEIFKKERLIILEKIKNKKNLEKEIDGLEREIREIDIKLNSLIQNENFKNLDTYEKNLKEVEIQLQSTTKEIENIKKILSILNDRREEILARIKNREKIKEEIKYLERVIEDLNILEICVRESQLIVRNKLIDAINYYLSIFWKKIYPYKDYIDARFLASEDDYIMQIKDSFGRWIDLDKIASGGERTLAAICLRIAFSKVLAPLLNIIIFDEPTHNLDREAIVQFAKIINENFAEIFSQVFIITHEESFKSIINANIIKVERNKTEDLPSQIILEE